MANTKEVIAIILDVGPAMNQAPPGEPTDLQTALEAIKMILQRKMFSESKDEISLILFGTPDTANDLAGDGESYENITVAKPVSPVTWELLQYIENDIQPSNISADFLDAMVVGMDHIVKGIQGKRGFGSKRLILFSNLGGEFGDDQLDDIIGSMKEADIELSVIGPDLDEDDDEEDGGGGAGANSSSNGHAKEKTPQQRAGEALLKHMMEHIESDSYSFAEALPALSYFQSRQTRSVAWKCNLEIGSNLKIPIQLYNKLKEAKAKGFKNVYAKNDEEELVRDRTFTLKDEDETEITNQSDIVEGHRYGSTLVPFSSDDKDAMKYKAEKCFKILGFTKTENVKRYQFMADCTQICKAEKGDESAGVALSALINALEETGFVAIVRRVYSNATGVKIGCLQPKIKLNNECLVYNELPFYEDLRLFNFGSLPVKEENTAANQKLAPSDDQLDLMDELIDTMDLSKADGGEEALKPKLTFNPHLQRFYQCLQHRALNPDDPLPDLSPVVANYLKPPEEVVTKSGPIVDKMKQKYKLTVVEKKKKEETGDAMFKDKDDTDGPAAKKVKTDDADLKGGMADLVKDKVTEVGTVTPVEDFIALISDKGQDNYDTACKMLEKRVVQLVTESFGTQFFGKALDCVKAYREQAIKNSEPKMFNSFLTDLKGSIKKDFWQQVSDDKVSLITKIECEDSGVTKEEGESFLAGEKQAAEPAKKDEPVEDEDDLLDDLA